MAVNNVLACTIANAASLSSEVKLGQRRLLAIQTPASLEGTSLAFQGSHDGTTWADVYDDAGTKYVVTCASSHYIVVDPSAFASFERIKVRTETAGVAEVQSGAADLKLITGPVLG